MVLQGAQSCETTGTQHIEAMQKIKDQSFNLRRHFM